MPLPDFRGAMYSSPPYEADLPLPVPRRKHRGIFRRLILLLVVGGLLSVSAFFLVRRTSPQTAQALVNRLPVRLDYDLTQLATLRFTHLEIQGAVLTDEKTILEILDLKRGDSLWNLSPAEVQRKLKTQPFIEDATVTRRLPDTIIISLKERAPVAIWQSHGHFLLLNELGETIAGQEISPDNHAAFEKLPLVVGRGANENITEILEALKPYPELTREMVALTRIGERRWDLHLKNGTLIKLPEEDVPGALRHLKEYETRLDFLRRPLPAIDLRDPEKMVLVLPETSPQNTEASHPAPPSVAKAPLPPPAGHLPAPHPNLEETLKVFQGDGKN